MPATIRSCSYCNSNFSKIEHLKRHERSHTGEKPFQCSICHKRFSRGDVLSRHFKGHSDSDRTAPAAARRRSHLSKSPSEPSAEESPAANGERHAPLDDSASPESSSTRDTASLDSTRPVNVRMPQPATQPGVAQASDMLHGQSRPETARDSPRSDVNGITQDLAFTFPEYPVSALGTNPTAVGDDLQTPRLDDILSGHHFGQLPAFIDQNTVFSAEKEPEWMMAMDTDFPMADSNIAGWVATPSLDPHTAQGCDRPVRTVSSSTSIPDGRLANMERLWSKKGARPWRLMQTLWTDATTHGAANILSTTATDGFHPSATSARSNLNGIDDARRSSLIEEYGSADSRLAQHNATREGRFPSPDTIGLCIHLYFQRFHPILPLIHRPTFSPPETPNLVLFPMFLIGYYLLDSNRYQRFVSTHLAKAAQRCTDALSKTWAKDEAHDLITLLTAATLILSCSVIMEEYMTCEDTYSLYSKTLSAAQHHSLFEFDKGPCIDAPVIHGTGIDTANDATWQQWARRESCKRLISSLLLLDSHYSSHMGSSPVVRVDSVNILAPDPPLLFASSNAHEWAKLVNQAEELDSQIVDLRPGRIMLPAGLSANPLAMHTTLSVIWSRLIDVRHRVMLQARARDCTILYPIEVCENDTSGSLILPMLRDVYSRYKNSLPQSEPNVQAAWHHLHVALTANIDLFELCAGREGSGSAKAALRSIRTWANSACARRACLHAGQVYRSMLGKKASDSMMFETEDALFNAALVLGLYLYVAPTTLHQPTTMQVGSSEPFELLSDVNWSEVGDEGLPGMSRQTLVVNNTAARFIRNGGPITFSGIAQAGGYSSARMVIVDYIELLEEVAKGKRGEHGRILRMICDTSNDPDLANEPV